MNTTISKASASNAFLHLSFFLISFFCFSKSTYSQTQTCSGGGDQITYGAGSWIGYVYDHNGAGNPVTNPFATYKGFVTEPQLFDRNWGNSGTSKPSCAASGDNFAVQYRMNYTFTPGTYRFTIGADDGVRLSIDGGATWIISNWVDHSYETRVADIPMGGNYNLILQYYEKGGDARVSFNVTALTTEIRLTNTNNKITACGSTFYDSGGNGATYSSNEDRTITFYPTNPCDKVRLTFTSFSTESGYDGMMIYNGNSVASPIISSGLGAGTNTTNCPVGSWRGTGSPGTINSTAADGSLTIRFRSDGSVNDAGWVAAINCIYTPPIINAGPDITICNGASIAINGSSVPASVFSWSGGPIASGGNTSTPLVNPISTTTYTMTATANGCTVTDEVVVTVNNLPTVPVTSASNPSICAPGTTDLLSKGMAPSDKVISLSTGSFSYVEAPNTATYNFTGTSNTVEMWVNPTSYTGQMIIYNKEDQYEAALQAGTGRLEWAYAINPSPGWAWVTTNTVIPLNTWTHIAIVHNRAGGTINSYVNGNLVHSQIVTSGVDILTGTNPFKIGNRAFNSPFYGKIDNLRLWSIARTQAQIAADMYLETPTVSTNLIANYPLNGNGNALVGTNGNLINAGGASWVDANYYTYTWSGGPSLPTASINETQTTGSISTPGTHLYTVLPTVSATGCAGTASPSVAILVYTPSTTLTTITPVAPTACHGNQMSFSASGGTAGSNEVIVWQEGACNTAYEQNWREQPFTTGSTTINSVNGILNVSSTSNDPMINMNSIGSFNPNIYKYINIRYKVTAGTAGTAQIFWQNGLYSGANAAQVKNIPLVSDNLWHIASIDMTNPALGPGNWLHSNVTGWRFDWATQNGVTMDIDFISLDEFPIIAEGPSYTTPPLSQTKTFYASRRSDCGSTGCMSSTVTLPTAGTTLSQNGESATCIVNGNNIINFYHSSGRLIASINPNGQNLGSVTATSYVDAGLAVPACGDPTNPNYVTATMGRHWVIKPTNQPASAVLVGLPFSPSEYSSVAAASLANANPNDNLTGIGSLKLSKYSGTNEDDLFSNNCGNGTTTLWDQSLSGNVTAYIGGYNLTDQYAAFSITSFSEFWLHGQTSSPLPVKLTNFSATCEKVVTLNWTTASEQNSDRFIVEKSRDGQTWSWVATQTAAGNSNTIINYTQTDENNWNGVTYYRLRQIDFNGTEEVYGPISVSCENKESSMTVYPNPNSGSFTIEIASKETYNNAQLFLTDLTGKVITSQSVNVANGTTQILINDLDLKMGTYLVTLRGADQQLKPVKVMVTK